MEQNKCNKCGRPMNYTTEPKCNYNDCCMNEYCGCKLGRIKEMEPTCDSTAVIPSITVESVEGITNLANCLVHVNDINTTFYVDDKHRVMITWAGPVDIPGYDMEGNPNGYRDQIVTDIEKGIAVIYDKHGKGYTFGIYDSLDSDGAVAQAINDKIDEMAADGTLADIISQYIGEPVFGFDTVADMKASTTLQAGDRARTLGFHTINDGGGATYKITDTGTANEMDVIAVGDLYANLITTPELVTPEMFGAYGDGVHDDHDAIALAFSRCKVVNFVQAKTYLTGSTLTLTYQMILNGNNSLLIGNSDGVYPIITVDGSTSPAWRTKININDLRIECGTAIDDRHHEGILFEKATDFTIRNVYVRYATNGFHFKNALIFQFENCHVQNTNCALYCDDVSSSHVNNVKFDKCNFVANKYVLNSTVFAFKNALFLNCEIEANTSDNDDAVIVIPGKQSGTGGSSLIFVGCWFEANAPRDIQSATDDYNPISVTDCYITHPANSAYSFAKGTDEKFTITLQNCQDLSAYINNGKTVEATSPYVSEINCRERTSPYSQQQIVGVANNFGTVNKTSVWEINLLQNGSTKKGQIKAFSDFVNISANETNGVRLNDCNYLHPFILGNIYLWPYSNKLYYKIGSAPVSYNDGTILAE